jgi:D-alanyl-D-alanine endopeptidase (penicillin-binding protein 7)
LPRDHQELAVVVGACYVKMMRGIFWPVWVVVMTFAVPQAWAELPEVKSRAAVVIDAETGAELFAKSADQVRGIASTTKIFVAMVARKRGLKLDGWTAIARGDARLALGGARTRLEVGHSFRNRDLLRAMLMASDNRAPTALGRAVGLDPAQLVKAMNALAKELGLKHTRFTDPSGLHGNVSTAREMALALKVALKDSVLREVMATEQVEVRSKNGRVRIAYTSTNQPLLARRFRVLGGKTGFTTAAGYCFITAAEIGGRKVLMSFLGAQGKLTRFGDFQRVAQWLEAGAPGNVVKPGAKPEATSAAKPEVHARRSGAGHRGSGHAQRQ